MRLKVATDSHDERTRIGDRLRTTISSSKDPTAHRGMRTLRCHSFKVSASGSSAICVSRSCCQTPRPSIEQHGSFFGFEIPIATEGLQQHAGLTLVQQLVQVGRGIGMGEVVQLGNPAGSGASSWRRDD